MTADTGWSNPLHVAPASSRDGRWFWLCYPCLDRDPASNSCCGHADTAAAAGDAARAHHRNECPTVREATNRLLLDVLAVPEFRALGMLVPGVGPLHLWGCMSCGRLITDRNGHIERHIEQRQPREADRG